MLFGNSAAYSPELKDASPSARTFAASLMPARQFGPPAYMAPEQEYAEIVGPAADVYTLAGFV